MVYLQKVGDSIEYINTYNRNRLHPSVSFPPASQATNEFLESVDLYVGDNTASPSKYTDGILATVLSDAWNLVEGRKYKQVWTVVEVAEEIVPTNIVRTVRNERLSRSDWTQASDHPTQLSSDSKSLWATYRQALRDVPTQAGFPDTVTWPTEPE
jgi:hypothetical protein